MKCRPAVIVDMDGTLCDVGAVVYLQEDSAGSMLFAKRVLSAPRTLQWLAGALITTAGDTRC